MNTNKEQATGVAVNETGTSDCNETGKSSPDDNQLKRNFGVTHLWSIRRNTRTLKIHDRIPRL